MNCVYEKLMWNVYQTPRNIFRAWISHIFMTLFCRPAKQSIAPLSNLDFNLKQKKRKQPANFQLLRDKALPMGKNIYFSGVERKYLKSFVLLLITE